MKMMRKFALVMLLCMSFILMPIEIQADSDVYTDGCFRYRVANEQAIVIECTFATDTDLVIPAELGGYPVTTIGSSAFNQCNGLTSVHIPDGVISIGDGAFRQCTRLSSVYIPDSVVWIGKYAFLGCGSLSGSVLPNNILYVGDGAFTGCDKIWDGATVYDNAIYLGNDKNPHLILAYANDDDIRSCNIHPDTKVINDHAFFNCKNLTDITMPEGLRSICSCAFWGCDSLTTVDIPESIEFVGENPFGECDNLQYNSYDNALYLGNLKNPYLVLCEATANTIDSCEIQKDAKVISGQAFRACKGLEDLTIPADVTGIGPQAFFMCSKLQKVILPCSLEILGEHAFNGCALDEVTYKGTQMQWNKTCIILDNTNLLAARFFYMPLLVGTGNESNEDSDNNNAGNEGSTVIVVALSSVAAGGVGATVATRVLRKKKTKDNK